MLMFYFIHPKSEHILVCHAMSSSQSLSPSLTILIWFELIIMIKNSGLTVFGSTCLTPSISLLLSSSSPSVRCKHHRKTLFIVGSPSLFGSLISASQCSPLSPTLIMIIDLMVMIIAMNHDRNHGDDKLINVVLPWN